MKLKVCGMKYQDNSHSVATLGPDYMGFIFWEPSKRYVGAQLPEIPAHIKKVGVFVDAGIAEIIEKVARFHLWGIQLHGMESPAFCADLRAKVLRSGELSKVKIIKVFSVDVHFDFTVLEPYEAVSDYYMFDTKGKLPGGNGYTFDWEVLKNYPSSKPYFLSGGIGLGEKDKIAAFLQTGASKYCHAIDVNSSFESEPGRKEPEKLKAFKALIQV
ncbi:phosphoribosylanthranilate isomerase [Flavobacteriaceae bacterium 3-367]|uniref:phosphoribosylanthranilate isomerase n=1 Tax=Eudoraea algarum TaxID=3417568 RepID=UPI003275C974